MSQLAANNVQEAPEVIRVLRFRPPAEFGRGHLMRRWMIAAREGRRGYRRESHRKGEPWQACTATRNRMITPHQRASRVERPRKVLFVRPADRSR